MVLEFLLQYVFAPLAWLAGRMIVAVGRGTALALGAARWLVAHTLNSGV